MALTSEETKWLSDAFKNIGIFSICNVSEIREIMSVVTEKHFSKGQEIIRQGDIGDFFFIIGQGTVSVWATEQGKPMQKIAELNSCDYFGEIALLTGQTRNATVIAETPCHLFMIYRNDFLGILSKNPELEIKFLKDVEKRIAERSFVLGQTKSGIKSKIKNLFGSKKQE
ncbi:MAG: cyclic nucleotide-binding domain-containing protein [Elusimicrobiota bacterium]